LNAAATLKGWTNQRKHEKERNIAQLAQGHLLSHKQNKLSVLFIGLAQQAAELAQKSRIFAELPHAFSSDELRLGRFGSLGGSSPS